METTEHFDVLIVGAGLSGIGAAYHLQTKCPNKRFAIFEARDSLGGTWDLFKYPGIRSDSDMYTLGFSFKPWTDPKSIADGPAIMDYLHETVREFGIDRKIRYRHRVQQVSWSSVEGRWTIDVEVGEDRKLTRYTTDFLFSCSGYYRYSAGYTPDFPGIGDFQGEIVHPQLWNEDVKYAGKKVVVIGSGATAVTLVPELAKDAEHVVMLQRSPTYMFIAPDSDPVRTWLESKNLLSDQGVYNVVRWKNILLSMAFYQFAKRRPDKAKEWLVEQVRQRLPADYDVEKHFVPHYNPWDQRVCLVPHGDMFKAISDGTASVVTDHIDTFTEQGIRLKSGEELEADLVVTATGLHVELGGGARMLVDGKTIVPNQSMAYRAMMLGDVPNFAFAVGYTNASWTLKVDIVCNYVCRLLNHMDKNGYDTCMPKLDPDMPDRPLLDFTAGYIKRALPRLPRAGAKHPWRVFENYILDRLMLDYGRMNDGIMTFGHRSGAAPNTSRPFVSSAFQRFQKMTGS